MKSLTVAAALVLTLAAAGCSSDDADSGEAAPAPAPATSGPATSGPADISEDAPDGTGQVLTAMVGTEEDPDAFEISLIDVAGEEVTELPAGDYSILVNDLSEIHNFHLKGGDVDETTTVPETGKKTFTVNLTAGDYEAVCDPHPRMVQKFTVT